MNASELQKTVNALYPIALALADHWTRMYARDSMDTFQFKDRKIGDPLIGAWAGTHTLVYRAPSRAEVILKDVNLAPTKSSDIEITDPVPVGPRELKRSIVETVPNDSPDAVHRVLKYEDEEEEGSWYSASDKGAEEAWASIAASFEQQVKYGDAAVHGVEGETKLGLTAEAGFKKAWERETAGGGDARSKHASLSSFEFDQQPWYEHQAIREEDVGPVERTIRGRALLTYRPVFHAPGVVVHEYPSMRALLATMRGREWEEKRYFGYSVYYRHPIAQPVEELAMFKDVYAYAEHTQRFDRGENRRMVLRGRAMDPERRLLDALAVVSQHGGSLELRRLAAKALDTGR